MRGVGLLALCVGLSLTAPGIEDFLHKHGFSNLTKNFPRRGGQDGGAIEPAARLESRSFSCLICYIYFLFSRPDESASASAVAAMCPWVSEGPDSTLTTSTSASTSSRALRSSGQSSYMSLPDTGRPGSAQATLTRQHCPHCDKFLLAKSMVRHINTQHKS